ncbi:fimbria/pilus outer membrane usher protein [Pseudomonas sp. TCU-HL1]|uniref:fimbria/pilus outer membrane usher protein n=1 Tax=Pseudomonas sp. TCU-HL1 TaxID=1856685 RepID=UPI00083E0C24|nr:fimbria/pilus outer membrane usher protein [Pseudomonas sp. TCU-HL1]AOE88137.1 usher CupC3 [Pseudomonas sp. TCU-HL1]
MSISRKKPNFKISSYSGAPCFMALGLALPTISPAVEFNPDFLQGSDAPVELKYFEQGSTVRPGSYDVDVYLNQTMFRRQGINFSANPESSEVRPVIRVGLLKELGVDVARLMRENLIPADVDDSTPLDIATLIPGASVEFDVNELALLISMPQAYVQRHSRGYVDPSLWDDGITALFTNYQANFSRNSNPGQTSDYRYIGLRNGLNLLGWRLRNESSLSGGTGMRNRFTSNRTFLERDIRRLKGTLSLGELYTQGDIFDSVRMRGVQLKSDIGMLPDNEIGYSPVVRGIAETNATVEVSQNGYVVYSTSVSPGAFEITDIYPSGSNGDLQIKIIEADGRERTYSQSYSYLPVMTRKGSLRYGVAAGEYRTDGQSSPTFTQGTAVYGATDNLTGYGGLLAAQKYNAVNLGVGINSGYGGLSFDVTNSQSKPQRGGRKQGQSARFLYSKTVSATDTTFTMVGYRYSTDGYRTLSQHVEDMDYISGERVGRQKSRFDLTINQSLRGRSSLFVSAGETNYWNRQGNTRRWQLGYSDSVRAASYSLAVSRTQEAGSMGQADTQFTASVSFPLGRTNSHRAYTSAVSSRNGDSSLRSGVSGFVDEQDTVSYSAQAGYSKDNSGSGSVGLGWDTSRASLSANYSRTRDSKHMDLGASGSVVLHSGGVTFGQSVGETFALVEVPDTRGIGLDSHSAIRTDSRGYAVVPYVQPYRYNWLNLDTTTLDSSTEITENAQMVVPTRGAVVKGRFAAATGRRLQFELSLDTGKKIPFGAQAFDEEGKSLGIVDNRSRLLVFGSKDSGRLDVRWEGDSCSVNYDLPPVNKELSYERFAALCQSN